MSKLQTSSSPYRGDYGERAFGGRRKKRNCFDSTLLLAQSVQVVQAIHHFGIFPTILYKRGRGHLQ
jgi:hypothetical protein